MPEINYCQPYHKGTTLARLARDEKAVGILQNYTPGLAAIARSQDPEWCACTLEQISRMSFMPYEPDKLAQAVKELSEIKIKPLPGETPAEGMKTPRKLKPLPHGRVQP